jgi:hypothetical protein
MRALARRGMLSGVIRNQQWPLITCDICEAIVPIALCGTPEEECLSNCKCQDSVQDSVSEACAFVDLADYKSFC